MRSSTAARSLLGTLMAAGVALMTGCSNGGPAPAPTVTVTKTSTTGTGQSAPASASPAASTEAAGPSKCQSGALKVGLGPGNAAAGSQIIPIQFTNISTSACTLYGFPGVSFTGETYAVQVGPAAARNHASAEQVVTLAPGAMASAQVKIVDAQNYPAGPCGLTTASGILVYPPDLAKAVGLPFNGYTCVHKWNVLTVNAIAAGPGT